jgi:hypothetical protein
MSSIRRSETPANPVLPAAFQWTYRPILSVSPCPTCGAADPTYGVPVEASPGDPVVGLDPASLDLCHGHAVMVSDGGAESAPAERPRKIPGAAERRSRGGSTARRADRALRPRVNPDAPDWALRHAADWPYRVTEADIKAEGYRMAAERSKSYTDWQYLGMLEDGQRGEVVKLAGRRHVEALEALVVRCSREYRDGLPAEVRHNGKNRVHHVTRPRVKVEPLPMIVRNKVGIWHDGKRITEAEAAEVLAPR